MGELSKLLNIGPVVEEQLNQVGISSTESEKEPAFTRSKSRIERIL